MAKFTGSKNSAPVSPLRNMAAQTPSSKKGLPPAGKIKGKSSVPPMFAKKGA